MIERGSIVIAGEKGPYARKPRPWVVVQNAVFLDEPSSITVCAISTSSPNATFRVAVQPDQRNNLEEPSVILVDKLVSLRHASVDQVTGTLDATTMERVDAALRYWLDI